MFIADSKYRLNCKGSIRISSNMNNRCIGGKFHYHGHIFRSTRIKSLKFPSLFRKYDLHIKNRWSLNIEKGELEDYWREKSFDLLLVLLNFVVDVVLLKVVMVLVQNF